MFINKILSFVIGGNTLPLGGVYLTTYYITNEELKKASIIAHYCM